MRRPTASSAATTLAGWPRANDATVHASHRILWPALGVVGAALAYTLANEPEGWWATAWIAPGLLLVCARRLGPARGGLFGVLFGALIGYGITGWAPHATLEYFAFNHAFAWAFSLAVWVVYSGIPLGLLAFLYAFAAPRLPLAARAPFGAWLWVGSDLLRTTLLTGMPWGLLGHTQSRNLVVLQVADLGGVYAVTFVVALVSTGVAEWIAAARREPITMRALLRHFALPASALAAVVAYGALCLSAPPPAAEPATRSIAVIQGHVPNAFRWQRAYFEQTLASYIELTRAAVLERPDLIVWPENAVSFYVEQEPYLRSQLARVSALAGDGFVFGGPRLVSANEARNSAYFIDASGVIGSTYDKRRLVPFAEYDPFAAWRGDGAGAELRYTAGRGAQLLRTGAARIGIVICYEVLFPDLVRELVRDGAELLVNLSNDSWMDPGDGVAPRQHLAMAVLRAVETRRALVRAAASGVSAFVTPYGEVVAALPPGSAGTLTRRVALHGDLTPYVRWGDGWAVAGTALALLAVLPLLRSAPQ